jgi:hypothetical protein
VAEVKKDETFDSLFKRLDEAVAKAKQEGPNTAALHDGRKAELIEPPSLGAEYREIAI